MWMVQLGMKKCVRITLKVKDQVTIYMHSSSNRNVHKTRRNWLHTVLILQSCFYLSTRNEAGTCLQSGAQGAWTPYGKAFNRPAWVIIDFIHMTQFISNSRVTYVLSTMLCLHLWLRTPSCHKQNSTLWHQWHELHSLIDKLYQLAGNTQTQIS